MSVKVSWNHNLNSVEEYEVIEAAKYAWSLSDWAQKTKTLVEIVKQKLGGRWSALLSKQATNGGHSSVIYSPKFIFLEIDDYYYFIWKSDS
jgi:hypothetical protein